MIRLYAGRFRFVIALLLGLAGSQWVLADASVDRVVGKAYDLKTGALLYRETHTLNNEIQNVEYSEPDGQVFGHKKIDYSQSKTAPSYTQVNERNGEVVKVVSNPQTITISYKKNRESQPEVATLQFEQGVLVDAGFNNFIKEYWQALNNGTKMDVKFVVPSRQTEIGFVIARSQCKPGTQKGAKCFSMTPRAWWVKLLVDPIVVAYDPSDKRLLRYTGRGNVANRNGDYPDVDIQYQYLKTPVKDSDQNVTY